MNQEAVRLMLCFAVLAQKLTDRLALLAGVREYQALSSPCVFKNIADAWVCRRRRGVRRLFHRRRTGRHRFSFVRLRLRVIKVLHGQAPDFFSSVKIRNNRLSAASGRHKLSRQFRISDGGGETDPTRIAAGHPTQPLDQTEGLKAAVRPQQGMDFINDNKPQIAEQRRNLHMLVNHQGFK